MSRGSKITAATLRQALVFSTTNLQSYASGRINANATDRSRAAAVGVNILIAGNTIAIPSLGAGTGAEARRSDVVNYINLLARVLNLRRFRFNLTVAGCAASSYIRNSRFTSDANQPAVNNPSLSAGISTGAEVAWSTVVAVNTRLRNSITNSTNASSPITNISYCHCNCHSNCHASRGRR